MDNYSKKIVFMIPHLKVSNGVARTLVNLVNKLDKNKFEITIIVLFAYEEAMRSQLRPDIKVQVLFGFYFRGLQKILGLIPSQILYKTLIKEHYDIEVSYSIGMPTKIMAYSSNKDAKHYCWMHGYDEKLEQLKYYNMYDKMICVSKENCDRLSKVLDDPEKVIYLYSIVDQDELREKAMEPIEIERRGITFITVSRVTRAKGQYRLLDILKELADENSPYMFYLWIVGAGPEIEPFKKFIQDNHLEQYVCLLGEQSNPFKYVAKADYFLCSSETEGLSTSCVEAAILGKPIISTRVGGATEICELQGAGTVVDVSTDAIKQAIIDLLKDTDKQQEWTIKAKKNACLFYKEARLEKFDALFSFQ